MKGIKAGYPIGLKRNLTSASGEQQNGVYTDETSDFEKNGHAATICVGVIMAVALLVLCGLLCYRQLNRRKKQFAIIQEKARRESIRQAVRLRLQELQHVHDSTPWLGQAEKKSSSVTFGGVELINPRDSPMDSPVLDHRKYDGNYAPQAYHRLHHHYNGRKHRVDHIPPRRDSLTSYHQQHHVRNLQRQLHVHEDQSKDNKIHMYPNSDHHRLSVLNSLEPATENIREASITSTNIHMLNKEHHRVPAHKQLEERTEQVREVATNSTNIQVHNNQHHKLSLQKQFQPATNHFREAAMNSSNILMDNNEHHKLSLQKQRTTERVRGLSVHSADSSHRPHKSNGSSIGDSHIPQKLSTTFSRKVVLHNGHSPRKPRSATVPMGVDAVY